MFGEEEFVGVESGEKKSFGPKDDVGVVGGRVIAEESSFVLDTLEVNHVAGERTVRHWIRGGVHGRHALSARAGVGMMRG